MKISQISVYTLIGALALINLVLPIDHFSQDKSASGAEQRADYLVNQMTLDEKLLLISGSAP